MNRKYSYNNEIINLTGLKYKKNKDGMEINASGAITQSNTFYLDSWVKKIILFFLGKNT